MLDCSEFTNYTVDKIKNDSWSLLDTCVGEAIANSRFERFQIVSTKTLYNYIKLELLDIKNTNLPIKLCINIKSTRVKKHKKNLGTIIAERPIDINNRNEFGHWDIVTITGEKSNNNNVLLTILECKTRYAIVLDIVSKTTNAVTDALNRVRSLLGEQFSKVFKAITCDNGSEFAYLSTIESETNIKVCFTHLYSSFEKCTNERHNGLIRRFIRKGKLQYILIYIFLF